MCSHFPVIILHNNVLMMRDASAWHISQVGENGEEKEGEKGQK